MRGMQYDARAMGALELHSSQGVYSRDQTATHFRRLQRSLNRHGKVHLGTATMDNINNIQSSYRSALQLVIHLPKKTLAHMPCRPLRRSLNLWQIASDCQ
jgi:hypothetical protein